MKNIEKIDIKHIDSIDIIIELGENNYINKVGLRINHKQLDISETLWYIANKYYVFTFAINTINKEYTEKNIKRQFEYIKDLYDKESVNLIKNSFNKIDIKSIKDSLIKYSEV